MSSESTFSSPGGTWEGNVFTGSRLGTWEIQARYKELVAYSTVVVDEHGMPVGLNIEPRLSLVEVGEPVKLTAWAVDNRGNTWEVTSETSFNTESGEGGTWNGNVFTPPSTGAWKVKGIYQGFSGTADVSVLSHVNRLRLPVIRK